MFSHLLALISDLSVTFGSAHTSQSIGLFPSNGMDLCPRFGMMSWLPCLRDRDRIRRLHPDTPTTAMKNNPTVINATMRGGEPAEEKRLAMVLGGSSESLVVGVEEAEARVLVGISI